jgi:hypothetical protein
MGLKSIFLYAIVVIIIYLVYSYLISDKTKSNLTALLNAKHETKIDAKKLPKGDSHDYAYSIWIYVNDWNYRYGEAKNIIQRSKVLNGKIEYAPRLYLDDNTNNLKVDITTISNPPTTKTCEINNIPIQKWVNIIVSVYNRTVDIYIDGKLNKTCLLPNVPTYNTSDLIIGDEGGFSGFTSKLEYWSRAIGPRKAYEVYKEGYGQGLFSGMLNKYRLKLSFMNDGVEVNSLEI